MTTLAVMSIGTEIKRERKAQRLSQKALAEIVGCNQQEISNYEKGEVTPTTKRLDDIAKALGKKWKLK